MNCAAALPTAFGGSPALRGFAGAQHVALEWRASYERSSRRHRAPEATIRRSQVRTVRILPPRRLFDGANLFDARNARNALVAHPSGHLRALPGEFSSACGPTPSLCSSSAAAQYDIVGDLPRAADVLRYFCPTLPSDSKRDIPRDVPNDSGRGCGRRRRRRRQRRPRGGVGAADRGVAGGAVGDDAPRRSRRGAVLGRGGGRLLRAAAAGAVTSSRCSSGRSCTATAALWPEPAGRSRRRAPMPGRGRAPRPAARATEWLTAAPHAGVRTSAEQGGGAAAANRRGQAFTSTAHSYTVCTPRPRRRRPAGGVPFVWRAQPRLLALRTGGGGGRRRARASRRGVPLASGWCRARPPRYGLVGDQAAWRAVSPSACRRDGCASTSSATRCATAGWRSRSCRAPSRTAATRRSGSVDAGRPVRRRARGVARGAAIERPMQFGFLGSLATSGHSRRRRALGLERLVELSRSSPAAAGVRAQASGCRRRVDQLGESLPSPPTPRIVTSPQQRHGRSFVSALPALADRVGRARAISASRAAARLGVARRELERLVEHWLRSEPVAVWRREGDASVCCALHTGSSSSESCRWCRRRDVDPSATPSPPPPTDLLVELNPP